MASYKNKFKRKGIYKGKKIIFSNIPEKNYSFEKNEKGNTWHRIVLTDYHKDQTGTYINDAYYTLFFFYDDVIYPYDVIVIKEIVSVESKKYSSKGINYQSTTVFANICKESDMQQENQYQQEDEEQEYYQGNQDNYGSTYDYDDDEFR